MNLREVKVSLNLALQNFIGFLVSLLFCYYPRRRCNVTTTWQLPPDSEMADDVANFCFVCFCLGVVCIYFVFVRCFYKLCYSSIDVWISPILPLFSPGVGYGSECVWGFVWCSLPWRRT